jgi:hypothetical protein
MFSVEAVGRLVQIRLASPLDTEGMARFVERARFVLLGVPRVIGIADLRRLNVMAPDSADMITTMLVRDNGRVERTAILVPSVQGSLGLQLTRMLRDAKAHARQLFDDPTEATVFLRDLLDPAEDLALDRFLAVDCVS